MCRTSMIIKTQNGGVVSQSSLLIVLIISAPSHSRPDPSYGVNLPHGSITYYGPDFGDNRRVDLDEFESSTRSSPNYVTSFKPNFSFNFGQWSPITSRPVTFFTNSQSTSPPPFSLYPSHEPRHQSPVGLTQGPVNSAIPISLFHPTLPTTVISSTTTRTTSISTSTTKTPTTTKTFNIKFDFSSFGKSLGRDNSASSYQEVKEEDPSDISQRTLEEIYLPGITTLNDIPLSDEKRRTRKVDFSSPGGRNITALIKKALSLVKKVEQIDERKKALQNTKIAEKKKKKQEKEEDEETEERERSSDKTIIELREKLRDLKEEKKFDNLKSFIQDQSSLANLIRSESSDIKDILSLSSQPRDRERDSKDTRRTREMISALARLNSISSLLLEENDKTKSNVRQLPQEIKAIVGDEIDGVRTLLEDQNLVVASALRSALSNQENRDERRTKAESKTDVIILRALAKLNNIAGILLKEQERTEQQTSSALKALPALAKFIQAETADIKDLIVDNEDLRESREEDLEELKDAVSQSLANDRLITRAIIKLNDITQLLLRDVNFTSSAVNDKLPRALTALITQETGKIREMIDLQNNAIVDILKESDNLARAEEVIQEAQNIRKNFLGESDLTINKNKVTKESDKLLELLRPFLEQKEDEEVEEEEEEEEDEENNEESSTSQSRADKLIEILGPILTKNSDVEDNLEEEVKEIESGSEEVLAAQLAGQRTIVQALLKLTNITRTLLEEKEQTEAPVQEEEVRSSGRPREREEVEIDQTEEFYDEEEDYEYYSDRLGRNKRPQTLVETIASSPGNRALRGNQALFEEFVKLAIDRQRWEQAHDVTKIIQSTLTSPPPPTFYYDDYQDYEYPDFDERRPSRRPVSPPRGRKRPFRQGSGRYEDRDQTRPDSYEDYEEDFDERPRSVVRGRPRPNQLQSDLRVEQRLKESFQRPKGLKSKPRLEDESSESRRFREQSKKTRIEEEGFPKRLRPGKRPRPDIRQKTTTTTTTEVPLEEYYEDYYPEEYLEYVDTIEEPDVEYEIEEEQDPVEENKALKKEVESPITPSSRTKSESRQQEERRQSLLRDQTNKKDRVAFFSRVRGRPRLLSTEAPRVVKETPVERLVPARPEAKVEESRRLTFKNSRLADTKLTESSNSPADKEEVEESHSRLENRVETEPTPRDTEVTEVTTPSSGEQKREELLERLLSHSRKKAGTTSTVTTIRLTSTESSTEEVRSSEIRGKFPRGRPFSRGGIPQRVVNEFKEEEKTNNRNSKEDILEKLKALSKGKSQTTPHPSPSITESPSIATRPTRTSTTPTTTTSSSTTTPTTTRPPTPPTTTTRPSTPQPTTTTPSTTSQSTLATRVPTSLRPRLTGSAPRRPAGVPTNRRGSQFPRKTQSETEEKKPERPRPSFTGRRKSQFRKPVADPLQEEREETVTRSEVPRRRKPFSRNNKEKSNRFNGPTQERDSSREESKEEAPLSDVERKSQKTERNILFRKLLEGKANDRGSNRLTKIKPIVAVRQEEKTEEKEKEMTPLENLFNIINEEKQGEEEVKTVVRVTSSSSSSSVSNKAGRKKVVKKSLRGSRGPAQLLHLSPQERLVKKVQETLRNENSEDDPVKDLTRPTSPRKKVIFRKRKEEEVRQQQVPRLGRSSRPGSSQIKSVKVRVRRIEEVPPFPIVY